MFDAGAINTVFKPIFARISTSKELGSPYTNTMFVVNKIWHEDKNYRIWDLDNGIKRCLILFSSNGIYAPNTEEAFVEKIVNNNWVAFLATVTE